MIYPQVGVSVANPNTAGFDAPPSLGFVPHPNPRIYELMYD